MQKTPATKRHYNIDPQKKKKKIPFMNPISF